MVADRPTFPAGSRPAVPGARTLSEAFDPRHYLAAYPDVAQAGLDPLLHWKLHGWREGRDPAPWFSSHAYLARAGLVLGEADPLAHWLAVGRERGLSPAPETETETETEAEAEATGPGPQAVPERTAAAEPQGPMAPEPEAPDAEAVAPEAAAPEAAGPEAASPGGPASDAARADPALGPLLRRAFDPAFYLRANPDVAGAAMDPLRHWLIHGWREGRDPAPWFSTAHYLGQVPALRDGLLDPLSHWLALGRTAGLTPAPAPIPAPLPRRPPPEADVAAIARELDPGAYLRAHPEVAAAGQLPAVHYLAEGAALGHDPDPSFSTDWYLRRNPDIAGSGLNPFVHYVRWGRREGREPRDPVEVLAAAHRPLVSVIVPNFNHAAFLARRLESIAAQTWRSFELIVLDDASSDDSVAVIRATLDRLGLEARVVVNEANSGGAFRQWRKGLSLARGELVWICESDDFCEPDFLERLVPHFADPSVTMAFGRIHFADREGAPMPGLDGFRERAEPGIWDAPLVRPAAEWFRRGFGTFNLLSNVGGGLFRNAPLPEAVWQEVEGMRICGDWFLYLHLAGTGQIVYEPAAVAWFRQHGANTSGGNFNKPHYYRELARVLRLLVDEWAIPEATRRAFLDSARAQWAHWGMGEGFEALFDEAALLAPGRPRPHVLLGFGGFHTGGGELFPINLANALLAAGLRVSMLATSLTDPNPDMVRRLSPRVPVFHARHLLGRRRGAFLREAGVTAVHTHIVNADLLLLDLGAPMLEVPYVATLHGSHAGLEAEAPHLVHRLVRAVDQWVYTADRNLHLLDSHPEARAAAIKLDNAMPADPRPARVTRASLGWDDGCVVFAMVARGIQRKGWRAAVEAFRTLVGPLGHPEARLLLVGEGPATDEARARAEGLPGVAFLGYQSEINGLLRESDALIVPSRFQGESNPLCVIQALQEGVPVVATAIGEIPAMLDAGPPPPGEGGADEGAAVEIAGEARLAGLLLPHERDTAAFTRSLALAMARLCEPGLREGAARRARRAGARFDMDRLVERYAALYDRLARRREAAEEAARAVLGAGAAASAAPREG